MNRKLALKLGQTALGLFLIQWYSITPSNLATSVVNAAWVYQGPEWPFWAFAIAANFALIREAWFVRAKGVMRIAVFLSSALGAGVAIEAAIMGLVEIISSLGVLFGDMWLQEDVLSGFSLVLFIALIVLGFVVAVWINWRILRTALQGEAE